MRYALAFLFWFLWLGISSAAVSDKFVCVMDWDHVRVGLQIQWEQCQRYLRRIDDAQSELDASVASLDRLIAKWSDAGYRRGVKKKLLSRKALLWTFRDRIVLAMDDYQLFLYRALKPTIDRLLASEQSRCEWFWQSTTGSVSGCWYGQDRLISHIGTSDSLDWLLTLLLEYQSLRNLSHGRG